MREHRWVTLLPLLALVSSPLWASTPRIDSVSPPQVFAAEDARVTLQGAGFDVGAGVVLHPGGPFVAGTINMYQTSDIAAAGSYAYVAASYSGLEIIDVSDPQAPAHAGSIETPGYPGGLALAGNHAYVAGWDYDAEKGNLQVIDVSDPQAPSIVGGIDLSIQVTGIAVAGNFACVVGYSLDGGGWLQVIDVSNSQAPVFAGSLAVDAQGIAVAGTYAYVVGSDSLQVIDVSVPQAPAVAGSLDTLEGEARDVAVVGDFAYVADGFGLEVIDVSDPQAPTLASRAASSGYPIGVAVAGNLAYLASGGLEVFDISDPRAPSLASRVTGYGNNFYTVAVAGDHAYAANWYYLYVIDVSEPKAPANLVGRVDPPGRAESVVTVGNHAYLAAGVEGLQVIDVSDPQSPFVAGQVDTPGWAYDVAVAGNYAYVADGEGEFTLRVIDISNTQAPVVVSEAWTAGGNTTGVAVAGNFAYLALGQWGLEVQDVTDPLNPILVYQYPTCPARDVTIAGNYAYLVCEREIDQDYLQVFDVSDPYAPALAGSTLPSGSIWDIAVSGSYAYVVSQDSQASWFQVIDFSDPQVPEGTARFSYGSRYSGMPTLSSVAVVGGHAVVEVEGALDIFDARDPASPQFAYRIDTTSNALDVAVAGKYAYAAGDHGLEIVQLNPELRDVNVVTDSTIELTVPAGFAKGPYHVQVTNIPNTWESATLYNGLHVTDHQSYSLDATLVPVLDPSLPDVTGAPKRWRVKVQGDAVFFEPVVRHQGLLLLPDLPATLKTRFEPAGASGQRAIELRLGRSIDVAGEVVLIGNDREQMTTIWESMRSSGGCALPLRDAHAYGDFVLQLSRAPQSGSEASHPVGGAARGVPAPGPAPIRYRYDLSAAGQLTAAHASGPEVDYVFEVVGRTATGVEAKDTVRYTEAVAAACKDFAALNPQVAVACPF